MKKRVIRLNENDIENLVKKIIKEEHVINESIFGGTKKLVTQYQEEVEDLIHQLNKIRHFEINWEMVNVTKPVLERLNDLLDEMTSNRRALKFFNKKGNLSKIENIKKNVGVDNYGMNRPDGLYLGNVRGLFTRKVDEWVMSDDKEAKTIVGKQLYTWLRNNLQNLLTILSEDMKTDHGQGYGSDVY